MEGFDDQANTCLIHFYKRTFKTHQAKWQWKVLTILESSSQTTSPSPRGTGRATSPTRSSSSSLSRNSRRATLPTSTEMPLRGTISGGSTSWRSTSRTWPGTTSSWQTSSSSPLGRCCLCLRRLPRKLLMRSLIQELMESPESVPHGEMPRHMQLFVDRSLTERAVPGNRVTVIGVYSIRKMAKLGRGGEKGAVGVRMPYLRVVGLQVETEGAGRTSSNLTFTQEDEESFRRLSSQPGVYETISKSIAPSIFGSDDIKKSIACLLFGGSRKRLPDGLTRRGDINVLLLGDPGTAKSQLLKFVERVSPVAVYTSGKGSSAAGLTASVMR